MPCAESLQTSRPRRTSLLLEVGAWAPSEWREVKAQVVPKALGGKVLVPGQPEPSGKGSDTPGLRRDTKGDLR